MQFALLSGVQMDGWAPGSAGGEVKEVLVVTLPRDFCTPFRLFLSPAVASAWIQPYLSRKPVNVLSQRI